MAGPLQFRRRFPFLLLILFVAFSGALAVPLGVWFALTLTPLQKEYFGPYAITAMPGGAARSVPLKWVYNTASKRQPERRASDPILGRPIRAYCFLFWANSDNETHLLRMDCAREPGYSFVGLLAAERPFALKSSRMKSSCRCSSQLWMHSYLRCSVRPLQTSAKFLIAPQHSRSSCS